MLGGEIPPTRPSPETQEHCTFYLGPVTALFKARQLTGVLALRVARARQLAVEESFNAHSSEGVGCLTITRQGSLTRRRSLVNDHSSTITRQRSLVKDDHASKHHSSGACAA
eukprot:2337997-Rhodomonas_salina.1